MIFNYIKNPSILINEESTGSSVWKDLPVLFIKLLIVLFIAGTVYSVISLILNPSSGLSFQDNYNNNLKDLVNNTPFAYIWIILIGPIYEEVTFRMGLSFKRNGFVISLFLIVFFVTGGRIITDKIDIQYLLDFAIRVIPLAILYFTVAKKITQKNVNFLKERYYNQIIYAVAIVFSIMHLPNYFTFHSSQILFYILIVLILFYISMTLSYIRIKHGLIYAIIYHASWNLFQMVIST